MSSASGIWRRQAAALVPALPRSSPSSSSSSHLPSSLRQQAFRSRPRRFQSNRPDAPPTPPNPTPPPPSSTAPSSSSSSSSSSAAEQAAARQQTRLHGILDRTQRWLPQRLRTPFANLRSAPLSHVGAFLVLHEVTAVVPVVGLTYLFYVMDWVPTAWVLGPWAAWAEEGLRKYVGYFRKKRWFGLRKGDGEEVLEGELREEIRHEKEKEAREGNKKKKEGRLWARWSGGGGGDGRAEKGEDAAKGSVVSEDTKREVASKTTQAWRKARQAVTLDNGEKGYKFGIQIAAAYAITKLLLAPRIALSLWLTPRFARGMVALKRRIWR
ncbi:hypothetical protein F4778DRAFT_7976 [Xylariomycetidae sp. FL2044]|nr:hypothetical protein F4778DRAFT_7976 [Xylariomycetidae sp. FL2044]